MNKENKNVLLKGMRDGIPIGLGYLAVSFSLGIIAKQINIHPALGFISSLFTRASAGEYGGYTMIMSHASYWGMILMCVITNLRYLLMNAALSQKFDVKTNMLTRILVATCCTDEIFGISIAYPGYLNPIYTFGATFVAAPLWALGTSLGIIAGSVLPARVVSALSVALYGMFIAIIIPASKKDKAVLISVIVSFILSYLCTLLPFIKDLSSGTRTIILTIIISAVFAIVHPVKETTQKSE